VARQRFQRSNVRRTPNRGWAGSVASVGTSIAANSRVLLSSFALDNDGIDETILRVVGSFGIASDQVAASELQLGAVGMCVVTDAAVAVGITALPDPVTDAGDDVWFFYKSFSFSFEVISAVGIRPDMTHMLEFDQKAKRIVHSGQSVVIVASNAHATNGYNISFNSRILSMVRGT